MNGKFRDLAYLVVAILFTLMVSGILIVMKNSSTSRSFTKLVPTQHASDGGSPASTHVAPAQATHGSIGTINVGMNLPPVGQQNHASLVPVDERCAAATAVQVCSHRGTGKSVGLAEAMNSFAQEVGSNFSTHSSDYHVLPLCCRLIIIHYYNFQAVMLAT